MPDRRSVMSIPDFVAECDKVDYIFGAQSVHGQRSIGFDLPMSGDLGAKNDRYVELCDLAGNPIQNRTEELFEYLCNAGRVVVLPHPVRNRLQGVER